MATEYLGTTQVRPLWCQRDAEVPYEEQARRLTLFRVKVLQEIDQDCTQVLEFCEEWRGAGIYTNFAPTWDAFCMEVLKVEPEWVDRLCEGLRLLRAEGRSGPVSATDAVTAYALRQTAGNPIGHNQYTPKEELLQRNNSSDIQQGNSKSYLVARLKRDAPEIAEDLAHGKYRSVRAAAKAAGIVRDLTPLDYLHRYWRQVPMAQRIQFLTEMLTPAERRALALGLEEDADV